MPTAKLTVIVPAYNVEDYLSSCLDSILGQSFTNLRVLIVNDGSTDSTRAAADDYANRHKRVNVIHKVNAGLGAARNTGLANSSTEFVTFVDSDDIVPPGTYERAIKSLIQTGSDVCIGSVERFDRRNRWQPFWVHLAHDSDRLSTTGTEFPPIMWDVFAWNKVYRRETWDRLVGKFPEDTLYEDQECTAKLFVGGAKLDILKEVGYRWRLRDDNSSITQQKTNIADLVQRFDVAFAVRETIREADSQFVKYWYMKTLGEDLYWYIRQVPRASTEFFSILSDRTSQLWSEAPISAIDSIDPVRRFLTYCAATGDRETLCRLLVQLERTKNSYHGTFEEGMINFNIEDSEGVPFDVPAEISRVEPTHMSQRVEISSYSFDLDGNVSFRGYAFLENLDVALGYSADLWNVDTEEVVATLPVSNEAGPVPDRYTDHYQNYADRRFCLSIPRFIIDDLGQEAQSTQGPNLRLRFHLHLGSYTWTQNGVKRDIHSSAGYPTASPLTSRGTRLAFQGDPRQYTDVVVLRPAASVEDISVTGNQLTVRVSSAVLDSVFMGINHEVDTHISVTSGKTEIARAPFVRVGDTATSILSLVNHRPTTSKIVDSYDIHMTSASGMRRALAINATQTSRHRNRELTIGMSGFGYAKLERPVQAATVDRIQVGADENSVVVAGTYALHPIAARAVTPTFALVDGSNIIYPSNVSIDQAGRTFVATFALVPGPPGTESLLRNDGRYILQLLLASGKSHPASAWVATSAEIEAQCPSELATTNYSVTVNAVGTSRSVRLDISPKGSSGALSGKWNERRNAIEFFSPRRELKSSTVLFESFSGNAIADSPLALDREIAYQFPEVDRIWTVRHPALNVPAGARSVVFGTREWFEAASTAKVLINNNNFPHYFRKQSDQFYLQTWHGTPLKRIGKHVPPTNLSLSYRELMGRESAHYWDLLIGQSPWAAGTLRDAFDYCGPIFDQGYPRNDVLADRSLSSEIRRNTRRALGINPGQRVVLYAPTWRDNLKEASGHYSKVDFLNVDVAAKKLGRSSTLLYRGHSNSFNSGPRKLSSSVIDASTYPDINDLIAASDVLITDYSSIMFDYVVTGRPIIFLCPDLDAYRDSVRGFYFDFESAAPGPIVKTASEAVDLLLSDQTFSVDSTDRYVSFVKRFSALDDGNASKRVVEEIRHILD